MTHFPPPAGAPSGPSFGPWSGPSFDPSFGPSFGQPAPPPARRPGELLDRFLARLIDHLLIGVVNGALVTVFVVGMLLDSAGSGVLGYGDSVVAGLVGSIAATAIGLGYFVALETSQGRTLGKRVMGLRVEGAGGGHPTVEESLKRNAWMALPLLGIVPVLGGLVGSLVQLVAVVLIAVGIANDPVRRRPWTDTFAGTQVLKEG